MEKDELNIALRSEVLQYALSVESGIMTVINNCLGVEREKPRALTHQNSSLSFKNKIDLLFDVEILSPEQHKTLLLLMEFRNQFLHNAECNTFTKAVKLLNRDVELRRFAQTGDDNDLETVYKDAFARLHFKCLGIILDAANSIKQKWVDKKKVIDDVVNFANFAIKYDYESFNEIVKMCQHQESDPKELIAFKTSVFSYVLSRTTAFTSTKEYQNLDHQILSNLTEEKMRNFFR